MEKYMIGIIKRARKTDWWREVNQYQGDHKDYSETYVEKVKTIYNRYCY